MTYSLQFTLRCFTVIVLLYGFRVSAQGDRLEDCILIIGDSIAAGQAVTRVPGYGFPVIASEPFSHVLDTYYNELDITHIGIYNLSVGASSLGTGGNVRYADTPQYAFAMTKRCQFAVIFPWINDLPNSNNSSATNAHIQQLVQLADAIHANSPNTQVVVTELGERVYGSSIEPSNIGVMNRAFVAACTDNGLLGSRQNVFCLHIEPFLLPLDDALMRSLTQAQFNTQGYRAYDLQGQGWLNDFWANNPNASIDVDGVHLSSIGKRRLAEGLHNYLQILNPAAFQTVAAF